MMKILILSEKKMVIFLMETKGLDFNNLKTLQEKLKTLFLKLKYQYQIKIEGFYQVKAYVDKHAGIVLEIDGEGMDEFDYLDGEIDMRIEVMEEEFLYETEDLLSIPKSLLEQMEIYFVKNKYILKPINKITWLKMGFLLEYTTCIYHNHNPYLLKEKIKFIVDTQTNVYYNKNRGVT